MKFTNHPNTPAKNRFVSWDTEFGHHGGIDLCQTGTAGNRRQAAELMWIERPSDYGYRTYGNGFGRYHYMTDPVSTGSTGMHNTEFHTWQIILDNKGVVQMWSVDGVDLTKYRGLSTGCATNTVVYPKIWSYSGSTLIVDRIAQITQRNDFDALKRELDPENAPLSAVPYHPKADSCEKLPDGSLKVNSLHNGHITTTICSIQGGGSYSGCFVPRPTSLTHRNTTDDLGGFGRTAPAAS